MNDRSLCPIWAELFATGTMEDLASEDRVALEQHLLSCADCAYAFQSYEALRSRFRMMIASEPKPPLTGQLLSLQAMIVKRNASEQTRTTAQDQILTDEALLEAIAGGSARAIEVLYQRYSSMLYSLACRIVFDQNVAEDILQEAFLSIWRHASSYSPQHGTARGWLVAIVRHLTIDYLRSFHRAKLKEARFAEVEPEVYLNIASQEPEPLEVVWHMIKAEQVHTALFQLPPQERIVLELAYFNYRTHTEIAKKIQTPLGTVKSRMRQGIHRLKDILEGIGLDEESNSLSH